MCFTMKCFFCFFFVRKFHIRTVTVSVAPLPQMLQHMLKRWCISVREGRRNEGEHEEQVMWAEAGENTHASRGPVVPLIWAAGSKGVCGGTGEGLDLLTRERVSRSQPGFPTLSVHLLPKILSGREREGGGAQNNRSVPSLRARDNCA